ncbi:MAG: EamA/RhaT family transporter [Rhodospirillales bacterium]|nr:EamA/RhaT family transporter [Rhodospirillales bacterium]
MTAPSQSLSAAKSGDSLLIQAMPFVFVFLWSTGFIGAKIVMPHAEPFTFLTVRFAIVGALMASAALVLGARWPGTWREAGHLGVVGLLIHAVYLGGVFFSIAHGFPAGLAALLVATQPILTALFAGPIAGERLSIQQWAGLVLGFAGVALVVGHKAAFEPGGLFGILACAVAVLGISAGTAYQKRFGGGMDLRSGSAIQFSAAAVPMALLALAFETREIQWTAEFLWGSAYMILVLSLGSVSIFLFLLRRGAVARVVSYLYLTPPTTAVLAYWIFGETLSVLTFAGMALIVLGVAMVLRKQVP